MFSHVVELPVVIIPILIRAPIIIPLFVIPVSVISITVIPLRVIPVLVVATFVYLYDRNHQEINRCYYEVTWGGAQRQTFEAEKEVNAVLEAERAAKADSIAAAEAAKQEKVNGVIKIAPKKAQ